MRYFANAETIATLGDMTAFIVENTMMTGGWGNGYVAIGSHHRLFNASDEQLDTLISIHKGVTFSQLIDDKFIIGFDTMHLGDNRENCDKDFVIEQTKSLLVQLAQLAG